MDTHLLNHPNSRAFNLPINRVFSHHQGHLIHQLNHLHNLTRFPQADQASNLSAIQLYFPVFSLRVIPPHNLFIHLVLHPLCSHIVLLRSIQVEFLPFNPAVVPPNLVLSLRISQVAILQTYQLSNLCLNQVENHPISRFVSLQCNHQLYHRICPPYNHLILRLPNLVISLLVNPLLNLYVFQPNSHLNYPLFIRLLNLPYNPMKFHHVNRLNHHLINQVMSHRDNLVYNPPVKRCFVLRGNLPTSLRINQLCNLSIIHLLSLFVSLQCNRRIYHQINPHFNHFIVPLPNQQISHYVNPHFNLSFVHLLTQQSYRQFIRR